MRKFPTLARLLSAAGLLALPLAGQAQFTAGRLVVAQATANTSPTTVSLVEYSTAGVAGISVPLPTAASGANRQFRIVGSSTTEGGLNLSADGSYLTILGYDAPAAPSPALPSTPATYNRVVARIGAAGASSVNTATVLSDAFSGGNLRSVVSNDGTQFWMSGSVEGVRYVGALGTGTATTSTLVSNTITNSRQLHIANGQLYQTTASGTVRGTYQVGTGLPIATGTAATVLLNAGAAVSPNATAFVDIDADGNPDVAYLVDGTTTVGGSGGIYKFSRTGATWTARGSVLNVAGFLYVTGRTSGSNVELYITTPTSIFSFTEATSNATSNISGTLSAALATTLSTTPFRGIAFAPSSAFTPSLAITQGATSYPNGGAAYSFGSQNTTTTSSAVAFTLTNTSATNTLTITGVSTTGDFAVSGAAPSGVVAASGTTTLNLTFTPTATGARTGTAVVSYTNATGSGTYVLNLSGTGTSVANPLIAVSQGATSYANGTTYNGFPSTASGSSSAPVQFTITNSGPDPLTIGPSAIATTGDFSVNSLSSTTVAASGGTATFNVVFSPTATGTRTGSFSIPNNSQTNNPYVVSLSGVATAAAPTATNYSATSLLAGYQSNEVVTGTNLTGATVSVTGSTAGTVVVGTATVSATTVTVTLLAPSAGSFTLNITTPGGVLTQVITVTTPPTGFFEPFELASRSANYATPNPVTLATGVWSLTEALLGSQAPSATPGSGEKKNNGQAVRFRTLGVAEMGFDKGNGAANISFVAALFGTDLDQTLQTIPGPASTIKVEISTNGGGAYTLVGTTTPLTATLTTYTFAANVGGNIRLRFTSNTTGTQPRINMDDLLVTDFASPATDLVVTGVQNISGVYNSVTIATGGVATVTGPLTVNTGLTVQSGGSLITNCQTINGAGTFTAASGSNVSICSAAGISASGATGAIQTAGTRSFSTDASYTYNGTVPQTSGSGLPSQVRNLTVNNTASLTANRTLTLSAPVAVSQLVRLQSGSLASGGNLTLLSVKGQGTALVDNTGGTVTGTATMQRAVDILTPENIGYHHYSSPVTATTINDLQTPGFDFVLNPSYNTATQAGAVRPFPTVFGYDERRMTPANGLTGTAMSSPATDLSMFDKGFFSPTSGDAMTPLRGYTANVPNDLTTDFTGTLNTGAVSITGLTRGADAQAGYHLLGNPYPSPINATGLAAVATNLNTAVYVFHSTSRYGGAYSTYLSTLAVAAGNSTARSSDAPSSIIPAGTGFFMQVTAPNSSTGALALTNANRVTTFNASAQPAFGRQTTATPTLTLALTGAGLTDHATVYFTAPATAGVDAAYDAAKLPNTNGLNLATVRGAQQLAINGRPVPTTATVLPLFIGVPTTGTYTLRPAQLSGFGSMTVYLRDALTGTRTLLNGSSSYRFAMSGYNAPGRFALEFAPAGTALATAAQALAAQVQLYPNPTQGRFHVVLPAGAKAASAVVTNALGQVVLTRTLTDNEADFSLATPGVYTLRLTVDGNALTRKVVVE